MADEPTIEQLKEQVRALAGTVADLTNQRQFFQVLLRSLPGIFYVFDENLRVFLWNKNVEEVTGYRGEEIEKVNLLNLFTGSDRENIRQSIRRVFERGESVTEADILTRDGRRIPYFFTGMSTVIGEKSYLVGVGLDLSQKKAAEGALKESEALYRIFADRMTEGVLLFSGKKIVFVNRALVAMCGYEDTPRFMDNEPLDLVAEGFAMYFREMYEALEAGVCQERFFQARWVARGGREFWAEGRANNITWMGRPSILVTARDITEAKLKEISMQEEAEQLRRENVTLRSSIKDRYRFGDIIGKSPAMQKVYELILNAAATSANVILYGESGTGKELVARAIHDMSSRAKNPFVPVNCAAIPENLLESEFFGHKKGAFTGAHTDKQGFLDLADGGTLFLDEVGELTPVLQVKLLRAIEGGGYTPVGSNVSKSSDFRVIAATHRNLLEQSRKGLMREDFFFRIHIIPVNLPPLRARKDDIPLLVEHFLRVYSPDKPPALPGRVLEELIAYDWPGNVRELQNVIQRYLTVKSLDFLTPEGFSTPAPPSPLSQRGAGGDFPVPPPSPQPPFFKGGSTSPGPPPEETSLKGATAGVEKNVILEALEQNKWNKSQTAEALGISRKTLFRKMKRFGL